jgi:CheY-like chemotaxis protein
MKTKPKVMKKSPKATKTKPKGAAAVRHKILIVDDDPGILELYSALLEDAGYLVDQADHALAAIASIVRSAPDLILADIRMPIIDGMGLVAELKAHSDSRHIPVVAITGYDSAESREAAMKAGYAEYITKPIDPLLFPAQIAKLLRQPKSKKSSKSR